MNTVAIYYKHVLADSTREIAHFHTSSGSRQNADILCLLIGASIPEEKLQFLHDYFPNLKEFIIYFTDCPELDDFLKLKQTAIAVFGADLSFKIKLCFDQYSQTFNEEEIRKLRALSNSQTQFSVEVNITGSNCYFLDDIYEAVESGKNGESFFYLAQSPASDSLTSEECFHVAQFIDKISANPALNIHKRAYYYQVATHLVLHNIRSCYISCAEIPLQVMVGKGLISISEGLKSINDAEQFFVDRRGLRVVDQSKLIRTIHLFKFLKSILNKKITKFIRKYFFLNKEKKASYIYEVPVVSKDIKTWKRILITGWYGTETAGDKAILGEVVHFVQANAPNCKLIVTTLDHRITDQTRLEMPELEKVQFIPIAKGGDKRVIQQVDAVFFGGGPIMDSDRLYEIRKMFLEANRQKKERIIFGAGLGPLKINKNKIIATDILGLSTRGFFRDKESFEYAKVLTPGKVFHYACDPAVGYIYRWKKLFGRDKKQNNKIRISTLLRGVTKEFHVDNTQKLNVLLANKIGQVLARVLRDNWEYNVDLLHMNAPHIGGDDRMFNRIVTREKVAKTESLHLVREYLPLNELIKIIDSSDAAIAMRYHGHIFCLVLGVPFISVDYTGKAGKVQSLIQRSGMEDYSLNWTDLESEKASVILDQIIEARKEQADKLNSEADKLVKELTTVYANVFNVEMTYV